MTFFIKVNLIYAIIPRIEISTIGSLKALRSMISEHVISCIEEIHAVSLFTHLFQQCICFYCSIPELGTTGKREAGTYDQLCLRHILQKFGVHFTLVIQNGLKRDSAGDIV